MAKVNQLAMLALGGQVGTIRQRAFRVLQTGLLADPFAATVVVVVPIRRHFVAVDAKRVALVVVSTAELDLGVLIPLSGADLHYALGPCLPDGVEAALVPRAPSVSTSPIFSQGKRI